MICLTCGKEKPMNEFVKSRGMPISRCLECQRMKNKKYYTKVTDRCQKFHVNPFKKNYDLSTREGIENYLYDIENG